MKAENSKRFLFVLWDGGGTIPPELALARQTAQAGHEVIVLGPASIKEKVEMFGAVFLPYRQAPDRDPKKPGKNAKKGSPAAEVFKASGPYADDVQEIMRSMLVDAIVPDYVLTGAYVAAEAAGIPCASLVPTIYPLPAPGLPPFGSGFFLAKGPAGRVRDAAVSFALQRLWNLNVRGLNKTRRRFGLSPVRSIKEQMLRAQRILVLSSSAFDFPTTLPPQAVYCGPQLGEASWLPPWQPPWPKNDETPLVLISLSTTFQTQEDLIRRLLLAVIDLRARVLVTLGFSMNPGNFTAPPNVVLASFVPHQQIMPQTSLAITHGGHGTVLGALSFGVPLVCIPMGRDQGDVAARVAWRGAGVKVSQKAKPEELRRAITRVLGDVRFREGARTIAADMAQKGEAQRAVKELEALRPLVKE
jgi:UDP:flavonoid glycosyltransferase YjiC (YdhE family)